MPGSASNPQLMASAPAAAPPADLGAIRAVLEADLARLSAEVGQVEEVLDSQLAGQLVGDEVDIALGLAGADQETFLVRNALDVLAQTASALARIEAGSYGSCALCRQPIDADRLHALPRCTTCLTCQQDHPMSRPRRS